MRVPSIQAQGALPRPLLLPASAPVENSPKSKGKPAAQGLLKDSGRQVTPTVPLASGECHWIPSGGGCVVLASLVTSADGTHGRWSPLCGETPGVSIWAQKCWKEVELLTPSPSCPFPGPPLKVLPSQRTAARIILGRRSGLSLAL